MHVNHYTDELTVTYLPNLLFSNPLPAYSTALPILFKRMLLRPSADQ